MGRHNHVAEWQAELPCARVGDQRAELPPAMLKALQRWLGPQRSEWSKVVAKITPAASPKATTAAWQDVAEWADLKRHTFKRTREGAGFVIDAGHGTSPNRSTSTSTSHNRSTSTSSSSNRSTSPSRNPWRMEWGPSQRSYIEGYELRFRMELELPSALQMLVLNRPLLESLEHESFERYTEVNQTQVDVSTSEEMRWVAMFAQSDLPGQRALRPHFAALSSPPLHVEAWLKGDLAAALLLVNASVLPSQTPWVLMTLRGRVYMRMALPDPKPASLDAMSKLFACACTEAQRVSGASSGAGTDFGTDFGTDADVTVPSVSAQSLRPLSTAWQTDVAPLK